MVVIDSTANVENENMQTNVSDKSFCIISRGLESGLLFDPHHTVELHFQEADEAPVLLAGDLVELQHAVHRVAREVKPLHRLLDGVVFGLALLFGSLGKVEVEFGIENLPVLLLRGDVVAVDVRADGDAGHAVSLLNLFGGVPLRQVGIDLVLSKGGVDMLLAVIVELADTHLRHLVLPGVGPYPFGIDLIFLGNLLGGVVFRDLEVLLRDHPLIRLAFEHEFDVGPPYQRHLPAEPRCAELLLLDQFVDVLAAYAHQTCRLRKSEVFLLLQR